MPKNSIEEGRPEGVNWTIGRCAVDGVPLTGFAFGCSANAQAIFPTPQQFTYFQGVGFDGSLLPFLEVDADGSVNVSGLPTRPYLTAGCGGFVAITTSARKIVFSGYFTVGLTVSADYGALKIDQEGEIAKFVPKVGHVIFNGEMAAERGQDVTSVTERCVLKLGQNGLSVVEIALGVDLQRDVLDRSGPQLKVSPDLKQIYARLFRPEPIGLDLARPLGQA